MIGIEDFKNKVGKFGRITMREELLIYVLELLQDKQKKYYQFTQNIPYLKLGV